MIDQYGRSITYLRISVTDLCNMRCVYCMPEHGVEKRTHREILSTEEIVEIARAAVSLGVYKLRITGGEPLVRRGICELCAQLAAIDGVKELCLTTNGVLLEELARPLKDAGVTRVNVSLDSLDPEKFHRLTRTGDLDQVIRGIRAAEAAGLTPLKLDTVIMGGWNDDEIPAMVELTRDRDFDIRFIELMPIGEAARLHADAFLPCDVVLERVPELVPCPRERSGVARMYRLPDGKGRVGLISPLSSHFCGDCNRIRLTADGKLKPCLHSSDEIPLRGLHGEALRKTLEDVMYHKPAQHGVLSSVSHSEAGRNMNQIGG